MRAGTLWGERAALFSEATVDSGRLRTLMELGRLCDQDSVLVRVSPEPLEDGLGGLVECSIGAGDSRASGGAMIASRLAVG